MDPFKPRLFEGFAAVAHGLAHPVRLLLLDHLAQAPASVEVLAARTGLPVANVSQHLQRLKRAGLVRSERAGKRVRYALVDDAVVDLVARLRAVAVANLAEVERVVRDRFAAEDDAEPMTREALRARLRAGDVVVLDVRPKEEFAAGHVPGAVNVPPDELEARLAELDPSVDIVAYCRGPYCVFSADAVAQLRARGFEARRLEDGLPEWRAAGLPTVTV